jgi:hypothetical protein
MTNSVYLRDFLLLYFKEICRTNGHCVHVIVSQCVDSVNSGELIKLGTWDIKLPIKG